MRLLDMMPYVLEALRTQGPVNQTDLSVMVAGTSGRNSTKMTQTLFPSMVRSGLISNTKIPGRRGVFYTITAKGELALDTVPMDPADRSWFRKFIDTLRADGEIG